MASPRHAQCSESVDLALVLGILAAVSLSQPPSPSISGAPVAWAGLAGLLGGLGGALVAAAWDVARSTDLARYLPNGSGALWGFLACLYAALCMPLSGLIGLGLAGLARQPAVRRWAHADHEAGAHPRRPAWQVLLLGLAALLLSMAALRPAALFALQRFHHRGLLSLLLTIYALLIAAATGLLGFAILSVNKGRVPSENASAATHDLQPAPSMRCSGPLSAWLLIVATGVAAFLALSVQVCAWVQKQPQWPTPSRADAVAVALPMLAAALLTLGLLLAGWLRRALADRGRLPDGPLSRIVCALVPLFGAGLALARQQADALRLVDLRPFATLAMAAMGASVCAWGIYRFFARRGPRASAQPSRWTQVAATIAALLAPALAWLMALQLGAREPLRKAGLSQAPLCERIIQTQALLLDWDGDGAAGRLSIGGSDCDDWDSSRHPSAFDWPDNGVDENCNAHDATTQPAANPRPLHIPEALPSQPNIVLITVDALRADHVSAYGYSRRTTPHLDALAADADSVVFDSAWAHAPSTRYSVPAILTGRYPSTIAWGSPQAHWPPEVLPQNRLLSEMLRDRGYATTALLSYHYFEPSWGLARGFDDYDTHLMVLHSMGGDPAATHGSSARELADLALAKLPALQAAGRPFFLWVHFYDPHYRYDRHPLEPGDVAFGEGEQDLYDEEIRYTDRHIGRLLSALKQSPSWNRTSVLVTADHGEGFGEHGIPPDRRHGYHLYANQTRVPFILRAAGLRTAFPAAPKRAAVPVAHVDIVPTLLHSVLRTSPHVVETQLLGQSLLPLLAQPDATPDRTVFQEVMYEGPTVRKALVTARWHLIQNLIPDGTLELYDLQQDPNETRDQAGLRSTDREQHDLQARLSAWMDDSAVPADFARRVADRVTSEPPTVKNPLSARIGDCLDVVGAEQSAAALRPGDALQVSVVYHPRCRVPAGFRLFFHLRSDVGTFVNADHDFLDGLIPAQNLPVGRYVRDVTRISLPAWFPRGPATLQIGLFQRSTRMPVSGATGQARVTDRAIVVGHIDVSAP